MALYRYIITPRSPQSTPWQSDTLYGHLLCAARELFGIDFLQHLLQSFESGNAPFILSSGFPRGMLPKPLLPSMTKTFFKTLANDLGSTLFEAQTSYKEFNKQMWLPVCDWSDVRDHLSSRTLFLHWWNKKSKTSSSTVQTFELHNTIDRRTGRGLDGLLYTTASIYHDTSSLLDLYVEAENHEIFEKLLKHLANQGMGKDRSVGKGAFSFIRDTDFDPEILMGSPNSWKMSLSMLSASELKGIEGYYGTMTKFGKVWNGFGQSNPFKKPFLALTEGSVFSCLPPQEY